MDTVPGRWWFPDRFDRKGYRRTVPRAFRMNDVIYGSNWCCPYSHGSHYSLRSNTYHRTAEGSRKTLYASKKGVAFGSGQGYLMNNKIYDSGSIWIRMYGYYDPDGKCHETFNEYVYKNIAQSPSNYSINTF